MPDKDGSEAVDTHGACGKEYLTARVKAFFDQVVDAAGRQIGADDHSFCVGGTDNGGKIVDGAEELPIAIRLGRDIPGNPIVTSGCRHGVRVSPRLAWRAYKDRHPRASVAGPHVTEHPFGELSNDEKCQPGRA